MLEDAGIKLAVVATDILGESGREMITALIAGERDPHCSPRWPATDARQDPRPHRSTDGRFTEHHAMLCRMMLDRIDAASATIDTLTTRSRPRSNSVPGRDRTLWQHPRGRHPTAEVIIAETGGDMSRFPTPAHLASWAGMCPGNNESAGKHFSGRTRSGNAWLCGMLGDCATAAARSKNTYIAERHRRIQRRRGRKRAKVAISRTILESAWWIMSKDVDYQDLGPEHFLTRTPNPARRAHRLILELRALGHDVSLPH